MIKCKIITNQNWESNLREHNKEIELFLQQISISESTFISLNTISISERGLIRTEIVYRENPSRKVIVEKENKNG